MTNKELVKLYELRYEVLKAYDNVKYISSELRDKCEKFIDGLMLNYNWGITADDTHRWVEPDGFYEVEFTLNTESGSVYIHTESGGIDLQERWSENNPQSVYSISECMLYNAFDWLYFIDRLIEKFGSDNGYRTYLLARDLCDGFEDTYEVTKVFATLNEIIEKEEITLDELIEMNDEDSGDVYDILVDYYK